MSFDNNDTQSFNSTSVAVEVIIGASVGGCVGLIIIGIIVILVRFLSQRNNDSLYNELPDELRWILNVKFMETQYPDIQHTEGDFLSLMDADSKEMQFLKKLLKESHQSFLIDFPVEQAHVISNKSLVRGFCQRKRLLQSRMLESPHLFMDQKWKKKKNELYQWTFDCFMSKCNEWPWNTGKEIQDCLILPVFIPAPSKQAFYLSFFGIDPNVPVLTLSELYGKGAHCSTNLAYVVSLIEAYEDPAILVCLTLPGNPRPVIYEDSMNSLKTFTPGVHSHFVCTKSNRAPCTQKTDKYYNEIVFEQFNQILPLYILKTTGKKTNLRESMAGPQADLQLPQQLLDYIDPKSYKSKYEKIHKSPAVYTTKVLPNSFEEQLFDLMMSGGYTHDGLRITSVHSVLNVSLVENFVSTATSFHKRSFCPRISYLHDNHNIPPAADQTLLNLLDLVRRFAWNQKFGLIYLPMFHGTSLKTAWKIIESGFAALSTIDAGFYGKGIYFTSHTVYTIPYIVNLDDPCIILSVVLPGCSVYPVLEHPRGPSSLLGKPLQKCYNSHYICTNKDGDPYFQDEKDTSIRDGPMYDELVVSQEGQILPMFILEVDSKSASSLIKEYTREIPPLPSHIPDVYDE